jgi:hypothetical protein
MQHIAVFSLEDAWAKVVKQVGQVSHIREVWTTILGDFLLPFAHSSSEREKERRD